MTQSRNLILAAARGALGAALGLALGCQMLFAVAGAAGPGAPDPSSFALQIGPLAFGGLEINIGN